MSVLFKNHLGKFIEIGDEEFTKVMSFFREQEVRKKQELMKEGQPCRFHYFVLKGCLRKFFVNDKGVERTTEFAIENWWLTDHVAYERRLPTEFYIQAVENSELLVIERDAQEQLLEEVPKMERYFRFVYQRAFAAAQMRVKFHYDYTRETLYHHFSSEFPEFVRRIPQYLIASYLGFTPEYLSEIRRKAIS